MITFGSLFSGIGGFDLGFERSGMECKWQVEIEPFCLEILSKHWPDVKKYNDVRRVGKQNLESVELVCGGFPCQNLSLAGKREGLAGSKSGLWFEFYRILEEIRPKWVVIENVPGMLSSNKGQDFAIILQGLVELRYGVCWRIFNSKNFGVTQSRRRVFVVGSFGTGCSGKVLFEPDSKLLETTSEWMVSNTLTAAGQTDNSGGGGNQIVVGRCSPTLVADGPQRNSGNCTGQLAIGNKLLTSIAIGDQRNFESGIGQITIGTLKARGVDTQSGIGYIGTTRSQDTNSIRMRETTRVSRRMDNSIVCSTLVANYSRISKNGNYGSGQIIATKSRLNTSLSEEDIKLKRQDKKRFKALGNAVTVPVIEWIGKRIVAIENEV